MIWDKKVNFIGEGKNFKNFCQCQHETFKQHKRKIPNDIKVAIEKESQAFLMTVTI